MRAVGGLGQAADVLAHGVARDPEPPGDLPQSEALDPTKVLTWRPYSPARLISSSGRIRPSPFSRIVAVVRASSRESATCPLGEPPGTPGTQSHLFQEGVCAEFPPPQWQVCRRHCQDVRLGTTPNCWRPPGEAAPSIRGADSVLAGTAVRTHRPKRGATVFHGHALHVPRRSLRPALQAVDFCSVRRCVRSCGHGQLLHWLASIQL